MTDGPPKPPVARPPNRFCVPTPGAGRSIAPGGTPAAQAGLPRGGITTPGVTTAGPSATAGSDKAGPSQAESPDGPVFQEIDILIRAKYPIIYIVTHEEDRVEAMIAKIARLQNKQCYAWSITRGMTTAGQGGGGRSRGSDASRDPMGAMDAVSENLENALFIFKDFHPFLQDVSVVRRLRELATYLRDSPRTLFIVSPVVKIPCELEKEITVVEFGFPSAHEVNQKLEEMICLVKDNPKIKINLPQSDREKLIKACSGLTLREVENVLSRTLIAQMKLDGEDLRAILREKEQIIKKSGILEYFSATEDLQNVGGLENLKDWLQKRTEAFTEKARAFGCTPPKGILLLGVQGCGKSLVAKAVSSLWKVPLLRLDMGRIFASLVGSSEENVRRAIQTAESVAPATLWIDEIEKAFSGVRSSGMTDSGIASRVFGTFITWLQEKTSPVFVIATSNRIRDLPPELFRKGRFDDIFFVDLPTAAERETIFGIHLRKRGRKPEAFDLVRLGRVSEGFSGSEIEEAISSAIYEAFFKRRELDTETVECALLETVPLSQTMKEEIDELRAWAAERARPASNVPNSLGTAFKRGARPNAR